MILEEIKMASTVLDGEGESTKEAAPSEEATASAALLDGEEETPAEAPAEEGTSEETAPSTPSEGGEEAAK